MTAIEQIKQLQQQGLSEQEINSKLQEQGISPKAINDAFNQIKIKDAVSGQEEENENYYNPQPQTNYSSPRTYEVGEDYSAPQQQTQNNLYQEQPAEEYYPQEGYDNYSAGGTETMIEVAEQVFSEKIKKIENQTNTLMEFSKLIETKLEGYYERLKKLETIMDKLQIAILEKVGSYGENLESIKKEMGMMQDSFSKTLPELAKKHKK
jgi:DNA-binding transcriptional MerR regulator